MKTADLIPLILLELNDGDKYGIELTKSIELKTNGKIDIKQPTLYTILKKLEKSKFISSYWQDSEIGGKRHYYRLTENGKAQVSTLPSFSSIVETVSDESDAEQIPQPTIEAQIEEATPVMTFDNLSQNESEEVANLAETKEESATQQSIFDHSQFEEPKLKPTKAQNTESVKTYSIMDLLLDDEPEKVEVKETILPTKEVFSSEHIDTQTEIQINEQNTALLKDDKTMQDETFASSNNVAKFTTSNPPLSEEYKTKLKQDLPKSNFSFKTATPVKNVEEVKYVDYQNIKTDVKYIYAKKATKNMLFRILSSCGFLALMLIICALIVNKTSGTALYYFSLIASLLVIIFSLTLFALKYQDFRLKCKNNPYNPNLKKRLLYASIAFAMIFMVVVIKNAVDKIPNMFAWSNFGNMYAPLLFSTTLYMDILFIKIFFKRNK